VEIARRAVISDDITSSSLRVRVCDEGSFTIFSQFGSDYLIHTATAMIR